MKKANLILLSLLFVSVSFVAADRGPSVPEAPSEPDPFEDIGDFLAADAFIGLIIPLLIVLVIMAIVLSLMRNLGNNVR